LDQPTIAKIDALYYGSIDCLWVLLEAIVSLWVLYIAFRATSAIIRSYHYTVINPLAWCLNATLLFKVVIGGRVQRVREEVSDMAQVPDYSRHEALQRLNQTLLQIDPYVLPPYPNLSIVSGPLDPPLLQITLSQLLQQQVELYRHKEAVVIPWTGARWTYQRLWDESNLQARALLKYGVRPRDRVGIMSGNCERYIALFFACARVGAICVTLNNTYTATEMEYALKHTSKYHRR
jgi:non-ribosomal peptide synthetase component F